MRNICFNPVDRLNWNELRGTKLKLMSLTHSRLHLFGIFRSLELEHICFLSEQSGSGSLTKIHRHFISQICNWCKMCSNQENSKETISGNSVLLFSLFKLLGNFSVIVENYSRPNVNELSQTILSNHDKSR